MKKKRVINYWESFYKKKINFKESTFAKFVYKKIKNKKLNGTLIDIGCGNGRDSVFFSKKNFKVLGIDIAKNAVKNELIYKKKNLTFKKFDIEKNTMSKKFDYIYSRFFLHAINDNTENKLIYLIRRLKKKNSYIFFEFRNHKDNIFRNKKIIKHNQILQFENGHYRRIIDPKKFIEKFFKKIKCKVIYNKSSKNLSVVKKDNPNLTRLIFKC
tara:strand:+ start:159 stop:797 length:639 start_codon:yes stop_codon:yes gene_type:complete